MSDLDILNEMIRDFAKVQLSNNYGRMQVELAEPQYPQSLTKICGLPDKTIVIKVDAFTSPDAVFAGSHDECKRADYVIISDADGKKVIIYIEMKATKKTKEAIIRQLKGAQCFISYCREIGRSFWKEKNFLEGYRQRFVSIGHTSIPKKPTRITRSTKVHDQPEKMLKIDWPAHLQFKLLAGA